MLKKSVFVLGLLASANIAAYDHGDSFDVWGSGTTAYQAESNARDLARTRCLNLGFSFANTEIVQTYSTGGGYISYAIVFCQNW